MNGEQVVFSIHTSLFTIHFCVLRVALPANLARARTRVRTRDITDRRLLIAVLPAGSWLLAPALNALRTPHLTLSFPFAIIEPYESDGLIGRPLFCPQDNRQGGGLHDWNRGLETVDRDS